MTIEGLTIGKGGIVAKPELHDGQLIGLSVDGGNLRLTCSDLDGSRYIVTIPNLLRLRADNFSEGNIIFELAIYEGTECPSNLVDSLQGYSTSSKANLLEKDMERIRAGNWSLLELSSSYGCNLLALSSSPSSSITVEEH